MTKGKKRAAFTGFGVVLLGVLAFSIYFFLTFRTVVVSGESMEPTFRSGQRLLVSKAYWLVGPIKEKDIVVVQGEKPTDYMIKRVYKLSGGIVDWANAPVNWAITDGEYRVPEGQLYILGDNREVSEDSRRFGPIRLDQVIGKVVVRR
ncbi:MAG TPA: signal peptidase I [Fimbriimonadaceae bacterium]|nr:signal peptidase I [Fimbriimonadaceae bacterium]